MAAGSLLALLDDIATVMDDVAALSKVAAKQTSGVLGDDLALNAQQVAGVKAERELPVVWAVAKGSLLNKAILVPAALIISAVFPQAIVWLLMAGGAYLCFEGAEKVFHALLRRGHHNPALAEAIRQPDADFVAIERDKIRGAIRTDFILSAEIIVICLGILANAAFTTQIIALVLLALAFTVGVYGLVAAIVKLDDAGLWLTQKTNTVAKLSGRGLLMLAPRLMRWLSVVGTLAMFMVGGGIFVHHVPALAHLSHDWTQTASTLLGSQAGLTVSIGSDLLAGLVIGASLALLIGFAQWCIKLGYRRR